MNLNRPASELYYPSMVVHLGLRFDETLMVVTDERYYSTPQTKPAADMQDPPQESPYLQPLVVPGSGSRVSPVLNRVPIKGFPQSNGHGRREPGHATVARMGNTLVEASRAGLSLQEAAKRIDRPYQTVATAASRMGLSFRHPFARAAS